MKNAMLLGLAVAVLFTVSVLLSIWLSQPKIGEDGEGKSSAKKHSTAGTGDKSARNIKPASPLALTADTSESMHFATHLQHEHARVAQREQEFEQQQELRQIVIEDIRSEMEAVQKQVQQLQAAASRRP